MGTSDPFITACGGVVMDERHQIRLRETKSGNPPDLLDKIQEAINELFDCSVSGAGNFVKGKGGQELAKAEEIKAKAIACLADLEFERQRLLAERDKLILEDKQKMYELKTQRLEAVVNSLVRLKELGVNVQAEVVVQQLFASMNE